LKVLYATTVSGTIGAFLVPHINMLLDSGYQVDIACNVESPINSQLLERGCRIFNIEFQRSPLEKRNFLAYKKLKKLIKSEGYDIVHTHTPIASACVRLACRNLAEVKVIYTAHGFHFFKGASFKNWLIYYPIERYLAKYTDVLITINKEDYERAKKSFEVRRVEYVPGVGLDTKKFSAVVVDKIHKREELGVPKDAVVILSVGELNKNKNHEVIIRAVAKLNNSDIYYVICGRGPLENRLKELSKELGLENHVKLLGDRRDIAEICKVVDIFAFPSFREGLSLALMEAMASGLPVVCSNIRGNTDLIENGKGGYLISPNDIDGYSRAIEEISQCNLIVDNQINMKNIKKFNVDNVKEKLKGIYDSLSGG